MHCIFLCSEHHANNTNPSILGNMALVSRSLIFSLCLIFILIPQATTQPSFICHTCSPGLGNYTTNSTYVANLAPIDWSKELLNVAGIDDYVNFGHNLWHRVKESDSGRRMEKSIRWVGIFHCLLGMENGRKCSRLFGYHLLLKTKSTVAK